MKIATKIECEPIGYVQAVRPHAEDDFWGGEEARIALAPGFAAQALQGLAEFSHIEVLFYFHQVDPAKSVLAEEVAAASRLRKAWLSLRF